MSLEVLSNQLAELYDKMSSWEHSIVKDSGLSPTQIHTVEIIGLNKNIRMKELAERLGVTTGTLTVSVDKLEKLGLVKRKPHENDRRSWLIVLTKKGEKVYERHHKFHQQFTNEISQDLSSRHVTTLTELLDTLLKRL
ncbi:MarR family winged helix-turn-helix transcriptional regulator [Desulforhopalus sp. IMCC35007]|uniref:MarR family winged helix-turn-helix transcriptional regulator n=1 Tax=Desulforhopalus sp. IMCC35007 TaxID=2569543 RepID=UPI0010AE3AD7|nr:MarR family transcriptional regulator [Desulforhopalus sp. IMCC35007]TKB10875.1 MarR family transcriptional regulator [Desulforhopalus sp. IMCC35007]